MQHTDVFLRDAVQSIVRDVVNDAIRIVDIDKRAALMHDGSAGTCTHLKLILNLRNLSNTSPLQRSLQELFLDTILTSEVKSSGALALSLKITNDLLRGSNFDYKTHLCDRISRLSCPTSVDLEHVISDVFTDEDELRDMFSEIIALTGVQGSVVIEKTCSDTHIELVSGYTFGVRPLIDVHIKFLEPKVCCIDGIVESVSEIHDLLESMSQTREPMLMFARGFSQDVVHTLSLNHVRGSLNVIPIQIPLDLNGVNTLKDIAIVAGGDVVSCQKGELISNITLSKCVSVQKATVQRDKIIIVNDSTRAAVNMHVAQLQRMKDEKNIECMSRLFDDRVRSLSSRHVIVRLKDDMEYVRKSQLLDHGLRGVKSLREFGLIDVDTPVYTGKVLTLSILIAVRCAHSFVEQVKTLGAAVV